MRSVMRRAARLMAAAGACVGAGTGTGTGAAPRIGTHDGTFHCDEALACALLRLLPRFRVRPRREPCPGTVRRNRGLLSGVAPCDRGQVPVAAGVTLGVSGAWSRPAATPRSSHCLGYPGIAGGHP